MIEKFKEFRFNERFNFLKKKGENSKGIIEDKGLKAFDNLFAPAVKLKIIHHMICKKVMVDTSEIGEVCPSLKFETGM